MTDNHTLDVEAAKANLERAGVSLQGPCGAFRILQLVAWRLRPTYGFLKKTGGNRAVLRIDGSCVGGDQTAAGEMGYATDYLIDRDTWYGYDILGDGGGANVPQWVGPETDFVARNRDHFAEPIDPGILIDPPPPPPTTSKVMLLTNRAIPAVSRGDLIPGPDPGTVAVVWPAGSQTVLSVQPDGRFETRPIQAIGGWETAVVRGNALVFHGGAWIVPMVVG